MVFMTKDYFVARVSRAEETLAVQELIDHIENWRYCKMIEFHGDSSEQRELSRSSVVRPEANKAKGADTSQVMAMIQEQLGREESMLMNEDPFGTSAILSMNYFNPQIVPTLPSKIFESSFIKQC